MARIPINRNGINKQSSTNGWTAATKIQGKELSYNNLVDLEAARQIIAEFADTVAVARLSNTPILVALEAVFRSL